MNQPESRILADTRILSEGKDMAEPEIGKSSKKDLIRAPLKGFVG